MPNDPADGPPNALGAIIRADFGAGMDQSADAWKVAPNQLASLTNGRIDLNGSVKKRFGYEVQQVPVSGPGYCVSADATGKTITVIDRAIDTDNDVRGNWHAECRNTARDYAPAAGMVWTTRGPASDVIGDIEYLDASSGETDQAFDMGAYGNWIFVLKCTKAPGARGATATTVTVTLSMYDATTRALIDASIFSLADAIYPKLVVLPQSQLVACCVMQPKTRVGIGTTVVPALATLFTVDFSATGLGASNFTVSTYEGDWYDLTAFAGLTNSVFRPLVPFDMAYATRFGADALCTVIYSSVTNRFYQSTYLVGFFNTLYLVDTVNWVAIGKAPVAIALSDADATGAIYAVAAIVTNVDMTLSYPYTGGATAIIMSVVNISTSALIGQFSQAFTATYCGAPVCVRDMDTPGPFPRWFASAEFHDPLTGHFLGQILVSAGAGILAAGTASSAVHSARPFVNDQFPSLGNYGYLSVRVPLVVGASQQDWVGRKPGGPPWVLMTDLGTNYPGDIGTAILVGDQQRRTTLISGPLQTIAPRLLPTSPPRPFKSLGFWFVPHRMATTGAGAFAISTIKLIPRGAGDVKNASYSQTQLASGGVLQCNDGEQYAEMALFDRPRVHEVVQTGNFANTDYPPGAYLAQGVVTYVDNKGNTHRSAPSDPCRFNVSGFGATYLTFYLSTQSYSGRTDCVFELYVTQPNGTVLRKLAAIKLGVNAFAGPGIFTYQADTFNFNNGVGLPALAAESIYTADGTIPFAPVPSCRFALVSQNRLIVGGADDRRSIYFSNVSQAGLAANFSVGSIIRLEDEIACTAAGTLNDKLILFSPYGAFVVFGQFPDRFGAGGTLSQPQSISDIGCTQPCSVIETPSGLLFFGSDNRFHLIDERMKTVPVGAKIQQLTLPMQETAGATSSTSGYSIIRACVPITEEREIRYFVESTTGQKRCILAYNWAADQWSVDRIANDDTLTWDGACFGSLGVLALGPLSWFVDTRTQWKDPQGYYYSMTLKTAWIQPSGMQGYQRLRFAQVLARTANEHQLNIRIAVDFKPSFVGNYIFTAAQLAPISGYGYPEQVRVQIARQKTQAVQITLYDEASESGLSTGQGPIFVGLALDVLPLPGLARLSSARKQ